MFLREFSRGEGRKGKGECECEEGRQGEEEEGVLEEGHRNREE